MIYSLSLRHSGSSNQVTVHDLTDARPLGIDEAEIPVFVRRREAMPRNLGGGMNKGLEARKLLLGRTLPQLEHK